jgi:succinyl-CoA synthetase beta subunit
MKIHEYQAKQLPVPQGVVAETADAAEAAARSLGGERWVVKAQVHAGGRGRAGGVRLVDSYDEVRKAAADLLGTRLVTSQTGPQGKAVKQVYVEQACDVERECYLALLVDRSVGRVSFIASTEGGTNITAAAARTPDRILRVTIDPARGLEHAQAARLAADLGLGGALETAAVALMSGLYDTFVRKDADLTKLRISATPSSRWKTSAFPSAASRR